MDMQESVAYTMGNSESPSMAVVRAISAIDGIEPDALEPLFESIDPEAVDKVVASVSTATLEFQYGDYRVEIQKDGGSTVRMRADK